MTSLALYSNKGGVGKTAAAVNLAFLAAESGLATLICDLDPQGSASFFFRIGPSPKLSAKRFLRGGRQIEKSIKATDYADLDLLPSSFSFRNMVLKMQARKKPRARLAKILAPFERRYATVVLDCPPGISLESESVFRAANVLLVPFIPSTLTKVSYGKLIDFLDRKGYPLDRVVPFLSLVDRRKKLHKETAEELKAGSGAFLHTEIPYSSAIEKMGLRREPLVASHPHCKASRAFQELWHEVAARLQPRYAER